MINTPHKKVSSKAGIVALLGAPNAGKSTLLNKLVGDKVSIVSAKAQTTRRRIMGIITDRHVQIVLIDTPGIFSPKGRLDRAMVRDAWDSLEGADEIVVLVDASARRAAEQAEAIIEVLAQRKLTALLVLNKIDKIARAKLLPLAQKYFDTGAFAETFMVSALTGDGVEDLKRYLADKMPQAEWMFPEDQLTDLPERLWAAEITREKLFEQLHEELPYAAAVLPEMWEERDNGSVAIHQTIIVLRPNHRAIVLGKNGAQIKKIGQAAREEIAASLGRKAHLFLNVKVDEDWQDKPEFYRVFGLEESDKPRRTAPKRKTRRHEH